MRIKFMYKNHRGDIEMRDVEPFILEYDPDPSFGYPPGWFLRCKDFSRGRTGSDIRSFAITNIIPPHRPQKIYQLVLQ